VWLGVKNAVSFSKDLEEDFELILAHSMDCVVSTVWV